MQTLLLSKQDEADNSRTPEDTSTVSLWAHAVMATPLNVESPFSKVSGHEMLFFYCPDLQWYGRRYRTWIDIVWVVGLESISFELSDLNCSLHACQAGISGTLKSWWTWKIALKNSKFFNYYDARSVFYLTSIC